MNKEEFPKEPAIVEFFTSGRKGTKKEIAETLSIPPNESPTKRWRDKLDSILRRLHKRGVLDRQKVAKGPRQLFEYCLHQESTVSVPETEPTSKVEVNESDVQN
jgi:hypothetical protein